MMRKWVINGNHKQLVKKLKEFQICTEECAIIKLHVNHYTFLNTFKLKFTSEYLFQQEYPKVHDAIKQILSKLSEIEKSLKHEK